MRHDLFSKPNKLYHKLCGHKEMEEPTKKKKNCRNCGEICGERVVGKTNAALPELRPIDVRENGGKALVVAI